MNRIRINGVDIIGGHSVSIVGNEVRIDGELVVVEGLKNAVEIKVLEGTINDLQTDRSVTCRNVEGNIKAGGSVACDAVRGSVEAGGSVSCDGVGGDIVAGGSVSCGKVGGSIRASNVSRN